MLPPNTSYGQNLRQTVAEREIMPLIGIYDTFSASVAAQHFDGLFLSGFGFAASYYGLPDIGFIAWPDIVALTERVRSILPSHHLVVDIDDGYCDVEVACHVVSLLEKAGASGVILEDQKRPRRCGHFNGKQILELDDYLEKLDRVLGTRDELFVVARTDAGEQLEIERRVQAFAEAGPDAILVDGLKDLQQISRLRDLVDLPLVFNQIAGGKSPQVDLNRLQELGASLIVYSTPCLFAAQEAIRSAMFALQENNGMLPAPGPDRVGVPECNAVLQANLDRRDQTNKPPQLTVRKAA